MRSVFGSDLREVFVVGGIADMMVAVFNLPMAPGDAQQVFRSGPLFGEAGKSESAILTKGVVLQVDGDPLNQESLTEMGKVDAGRSGGHGDFPVFKPAMSDIGALSAEGENRPRRGRSVGRGVFAGCL